MWYTTTQLTFAHKWFHLINLTIAIMHKPLPNSRAEPTPRLRNMSLLASSTLIFLCLVSSYTRLSFCGDIIACMWRWELAEVLNVVLTSLYILFKLISAHTHAPKGTDTLYFYCFLNNRSWGIRHIFISEVLKIKPWAHTIFPRDTQLLACVFWVPFQCQALA